MFWPSPSRCWRGTFLAWRRGGGRLFSIAALGGSQLMATRISGGYRLLLLEYDNILAYSSNSNRHPAGIRVATS